LANERASDTNDRRSKSRKGRPGSGISRPEETNLGKAEREPEEYHNQPILEPEGFEQRWGLMLHRASSCPLIIAAQPIDS
jgi:hypothetical protein